MDVPRGSLVEATRALLKKPWFKSSTMFFREILKKSLGKDLRDPEGNTLAHLAALYGNAHDVKNYSHLLNIKNHEHVSANDLLFFLHTPLENREKALYVYKTQEERFTYLSSEEVKKYFQIDFLDHLVFQKREYLRWTLKKCQKKLKESSVKIRNRWSQSLYGHAFLHQQSPLTYIKWIDPLVGYGLFAAEEIGQYALIGEYTGIIRKRSSKLDKYNHYIFGYVTGDEETSFVIDAEKQGNHTRFINHSDDPNLQSTWLISQGICHVVFIAKHKIAKHTQLTYDYGPMYWKKRSDPLNI